jgi:hypothetical protein
MVYFSLHMENVSNTGNVLYCVTFEQQEKHDGDDEIMCLSLLCMTHELIIKQLRYR